MSQVVIYGFETSNNFKVRIALGFKGIDYRFETIDPSDRAEIVRISGQPFTPVVVHVSAGGVPLRRQDAMTSAQTMLTGLCACSRCPRI